jgi:hypothetical protein
LAPAPKRVKGAVDVAPPERRPAEDCATPAPLRPPTPKPRRALPASGAVEALDVALPEEFEEGASRLVDCPRVEDPRVAPNGIHISRQFAPAGQLSP